MSQIDSGSSDKSGLGEDASELLYLCNFVHKGYYNIRITWGEVKKVMSFSLRDGPDNACRQLKENAYVEDYDDAEPFMIIRRPDVKLSRERKIEVLKGLFHVLNDVPLAYNVALLASVQRSLMMGIVGSFYDHEIKFTSTPEQRILISAVTSDDFLEDDDVSDLLNQEIRRVESRDRELHGYLSEPWFNELLLIIKNGYYGNGSFNYIDTLESSFRMEFTRGVIEIIRNGSLLWLLLNFREFLKRNNVDRVVKKFVRKRRDERKINRLYDWLSLLNDFAIGFEFVIGSIEFLPGYDSTFGVYLFIVGSSQLLIRPIISTARKVHIRKLQRRKMDL